MSIQAFKCEVFGRDTVSVELGTRVVIRAKAGDKAFEFIVLGKVESAYNAKFGKDVRLTWEDLTQLRLDIP